jgi:sugar lactone lactonase YvrE
MRLSARSHRFVTFLVCLLLLAVAPVAHAAPVSLTFAGLVRTINTGGSITLSSPAALVVDPAGDVFIADTNNSRIVEVNAQGTASVLSITGLSPASLSSPSALAIDGAGNLYIADTGNSRVVKVSSSGAGSAISTGSVSLSLPQGVALDQSGDIFIADTGHSQIVEVTSGGSAAALTISVSSGSPSLSSPRGLAVNVSGKLFIADSGNNRVVTVAAGSTTGVVQSVGGLVPGLSGPSSVAVDRIGNVYVADTGNNRITELDTAGNGNSLLISSLYLQGTTLSGALGVAIDNFGAVYIADTGASRVLVVNPYIDADPASSAAVYTSSLNKSAVGFGHITLGSPTPTSLTLNFTVGSPVTGLGSVNAFTSGTRGLDFQIVSGGNTTCSSSTELGASCTVEVRFLPTAPGLRNGAVVLYDADSSPILSVPLYGFGDAPVAALSPNTGSVISTGGLSTQNPYELALDGAGNMYVGVYSGSNVTRIPSGGGSASVVNLGTPGGRAKQNITGVALDGAGNLFIGDHQNSRILVVTPGGQVSVLSITGLSPALGFPTALVFDAAGILYIADFTNGRIVEVSSLIITGSASTGIGRVLGTGSYSFSGSTLTGLSVDNQGTLYAAARTQNSSSIVKVTPSGVASLVSIPGNVTPAISNPQGVAVDPMGNLYIVDTAHNRIVQLTNAGVASVLNISGLPTPASLGPTLFGVTVDSSGNLYILDWTNNRIVFANVSGAALKFPTATRQGTTDSTDGPKTATVANLGNQPLIFSTNPNYSADFPNYSGDTNPCTSSTSLSAGTICDVALNFVPQSTGSISAGITVTNNTLNVAGSTQQVSASGTGTNPGDNTTTSVTISPTALVSGQAATITATVSDTTHTSTTATGSVTFTDTAGTTITSLNNGSAVSLSGGTAGLTGVVLSGINTHTITAHYAGVSGTFSASTNTATVTLSKAPVTLAGPVTQPITVAFGQASSAIVTVTAPYTTIAAPSGTVSYSIVDSSNATIVSGTPTLAAGSASSAATIPIPSTLPSGSYTIRVTYSGDSNYLATSTATTIPLQIGQLTPTISLATSANPVLVTTAVTFTATVASTSAAAAGSVSFLDGTTLLSSAAVSSGTASYTTSSLAAGAHSITAVYGGNTYLAGATSSAVAELVQDYALSISGSGSGGSGSGTSQTVVPGGTATYTLSLGPSNGTTFPAPITLSVSGLPPGATATITPNTLPAGSSLTNVTLTVQLPQVTAALDEKRPPDRQIPLALWSILLLPFAGKLRRAGRRLTQSASLLILLAVGVAAAAGLSGCGSSNGFFGHPQQTYTLTITATSGSVSHSTTVTLTVE